MSSRNRRNSGQQQGGRHQGNQQRNQGGQYNGGQQTAQRRPGGRQDQRYAEGGDYDDQSYQQYGADRGQGQYRSMDDQDEYDENQHNSRNDYDSQGNDDWQDHRSGRRSDLDIGQYPDYTRGQMGRSYGGNQPSWQSGNWSNSGNQRDWGRGQGMESQWSQQSGRRGTQDYQQSNSGSGEHFGKGPKGYRRSDERIQEEINEQLTQNSDIDPSEVEVQVKDGEVTLTGTVDSRNAKRLAEDIAEGISGVREVSNQIRVRRNDEATSMGSSGSQGTKHRSTETKERSAETKG